MRQDDDSLATDGDRNEQDRGFRGSEVQAIGGPEPPPGRILRTARGSRRSEDQAIGGPEPDPGRILRAAEGSEDSQTQAAGGPEPPPGRILRSLLRSLRRLFGREPVRT